MASEGDGTKTTTYVSGTAALNVHLPGDATPGDWHRSAVHWDQALVIEAPDAPRLRSHLRCADVPGHGRCLVADHVLACVDLVRLGYTGSAGGMRDAFLDDPSTTPYVFDELARERGGDKWPEVDEFLGKEYGTAWLDYKERRWTGQDTDRP